MNGQVLADMIIAITLSQQSLSITAWHEIFAGVQSRGLIADFLRFAGTNCSEFGLHNLPLGIDFRESKVSPAPVFVITVQQMDVISLLSDLRTVRFRISFGPKK